MSETLGECIIRDSRATGAEGYVDCQHTAEGEEPEWPSADSLNQ